MTSNASESEDGDKSSTESNTFTSGDIPGDTAYNQHRNQRANVWLRKEWGAVPPLWTKPLEVPIDKVVLSRIETEPCLSFNECKKKMQHLQEAHMKAGAPDILYNYVIGGDGAIYEGRGFDVEGPTYPVTAKGLEKLSKKSIDIALIMPMQETAPACMLKAVSDCIVIGAVGKFILPAFDMYWVANNEIQHIEHGLGYQVMGKLPES